MLCLKIIFSLILFFSVSDYSQPSLNKSTQHGTYDYFFNLTYFYSRDRVQVSEFSGYNEVANRYDRISSCRIWLSYIYGQILVVHPSECNQLSCSCTFQHGNRTKNRNIDYYSL